MLLKAFVLLVLGTAVLTSPIPEAKIVGGSPAIDGQFPYMVSLRTTSMWHFCGGSIISENWVLSAAHCTIDKHSGNSLVVSGTVKLTGGVNPIVHSVARVINHENYRDEVFAFDVSVVRVVQPFVWTNRVAAIRMNPNFIGGGLAALAMGWGQTTQNATGPSSNDLMWINTSTVTFSICRNQLGSWVIEQHLCSFAREGQGICMGDSGGPLVVNNEVVGIASGVIPCALGWPDVWDRVSTFHSWIIAHAVG